MRSTLHDSYHGIAARIIKVDHAGEYGAVNIYRAQLFVAQLTARSLLPVLQEFLDHEWRHMDEFRRYLERRQIARCRSYGLCGAGGYALGFLTALLGRPGIMACTAAVQSVVSRHLAKQVEELRAVGDTEALAAVRSVIADELKHLETGVTQGRGSILYWPVVAVVSAATSFVIWLGMTL